jgi:hypothetical protein
MSSQSVSAHQSLKADSDGAFFRDLQASFLCSLARLQEDLFHGRGFPKGYSGSRNLKLAASAEYRFREGSSLLRNSLVCHLRSGHRHSVICNLDNPIWKLQIAYRRRNTGERPMSGDQFKSRKFTELIVYIAKRLGPEAALGRVKLAKLLMASDFEDELGVIETALLQFGHESATHLSNLSHQELGWRLANWKEVIPYRTVYLGRGGVSNADLRRGEELASSHGWN